MIHPELPTRSSYGIINKDEQFYFGVTQKIYGNELTGQAGFIMSLNRHRKTPFFGDEISTNENIIESQ